MLSWERIAEMARGECAHDEQSYRTPETLERYRARGCTLDLDFATEWLFVRNAYPYDTEPGITHHVLFRRRDLPMASPRGFLDGAAFGPFATSTCSSASENAKRRFFSF